MPDGRGFTADPEAVKSAAGGLEVAADNLEDAAKELQSALSAQGECWGDDDSGKEFAKDYVPGAQGAVEGFGNLVEGLRGLYRNVDQSMKALQGADQTVADTLTKGKGQ
ncbi:WXG100 family type VII secretion target [Amycolatopsis samaneae]|uniref:WXG100 family type VII secretion target n=1 Tax=Amycolatopsis samaneae TaxID=664691 RepID=A0ABW5GJV4_9PSEU